MEKSKQVPMSNFETLYACAICKKEFRNAIPLVKHVQWRHTPTNQILTNSSESNETNKSHNIDNKKSNSSNSKNETKSNKDQPFVIKIEENETDDGKQYNTQYLSKLLEINDIETEKSNTNHGPSYNSSIMLSNLSY